jgi:hypothetical protein
MKLDAATLYAVLISAYLLLGIVMLCTFRRPLEDGKDLWTASLFVGVAALVLLVTRYTLPWSRSGEKNRCRRSNGRVSTDSPLRFAGQPPPRCLSARGASF